MNHGIISFITVKGDGPTPFGRNYLDYIALNWKKIFNARYSDQEMKGLKPRF